MPLQATSGAASYDAFGGGVPVVPAYIEEVFSTYLYDGNDTARSIVNGIDLSTKGGLVWVKGRNLSWSHTLYDTVNGVGVGPLNTATTDAPNPANNQRVTAFNTDGFSLGTNGNVNGSTYTYASWTFRKQPKFFDVVTYTGNGSQPRAIAHSLGSTPGCMIVKNVTTASSWYVYHRGAAAPGYTAPQCYMILNDTNAVTDNAFIWGNTAPTSTQFTVSTQLNQSANTYVAYIFAHDAGGFGLTGTDNVITCNSVTTDGSGNATVDLGYEPQWVMIKSTALGSDWNIVDTMRGLAVSNGAYNGVSLLRANVTNAESSAAFIEPSATGFKLAFYAAGSQTYIYIAIRRGPMKVPTDATKVFVPVTYTGTGAAATITGVGFAPDAVFPSLRASFGSESGKFDRLRGVSKYLVTSSTVAEATDAGNSLLSFDMDGITLGATGTSYINGGGGYTYINHFFKRAPSFFDEVCYTGTGAARTVAHNLGVAPELMIVKARTGAYFWPVWSSAFPITQRLQLESNSALGTQDLFNSTVPTSTVFSLSAAAGVSAVNQNPSSGSIDYVAYLFATCAGVSKVGSYTGTATTKQIDCGFTAGARFVLIKRTDSTGDWYVWDTARGIVSGNDPYVRLNSTAAEVTSTDYIDPYSAGFELSSTAPADLNASGGTYIFLAIA